MKILFDNNGFAKLAQQPQRATHLQKVKDLVERGEVTVTGCCTMLQELSGLADPLGEDKTKTRIYLHTLSEYEQVTQGEILQPAPELLKMELQQPKPLVYQDLLLSKENAKILISNLKNLENADLLFSEAKSFKGGYAIVMEGAYEEVLSQLDPENKLTKDIITVSHDWFERFDATIQEWYKNLLSHLNVRSNFAVKELPHVFAFLGFVLTRIYERFALNIKDRDNDLFDRAYFIDAAVVDILVTDDRVFRRTARAVPKRNVEIMDLDEFASFIDRRYSA
jgi:hypothetical protein